MNLIQTIEAMLTPELRKTNRQKTLFINMIISECSRGKIKFQDVSDTQVINVINMLIDSEVTKHIYNNLTTEELKRKDLNEYVPMRVYELKNTISTDIITFLRSLIPADVTVKPQVDIESIKKWISDNIDIGALGDKKLSAMGRLKKQYPDVSKDILLSILKSI